MTVHEFVAAGKFDDTANLPLEKQFVSLKLVVGDDEKVNILAGAAKDKTIENVNDIPEGVLLTTSGTKEIGHTYDSNDLNKDQLSDLANKIKNAAAPTTAGKILGGSRARGDSYKRTQKRRQRKQQRRNGKSKRV